MSYIDPTDEDVIKAINRILADDANYQCASLKIGGIWDWCDRYATFERRKDDFGLKWIEVRKRTADPTNDKTVEGSL